jgi:hypothetical protein
MSATEAATRLTIDSSASESRPTEPVNAYAAPFRQMMTAAAAMESHAKRVSVERGAAMWFIYHTAHRHDNPETA